MPEVPATLLERFLRERTGMVFAGVRREILAAIAVELAGKAGRTEDHYVAELVAGGEALDELLAMVTVGETYFFRDLETLVALEKTIIPAQLAARPTQHRYRAWSAACASGEEAYTLAMLLEDVGLAGRFDVLGTDLNVAALARARAGVYPEWSLRGPGADRARARLDRQEGRVVVPERLRRGVRFEQLNLASDAYPSVTTGTADLDLILCRNVLIYLDPPTIARVASQLYRALAPGGWLVMSPTDPPLRKLAPWSSSRAGGSACYLRDAEPEVRSRSRPVTAPPAIRTPPPPPLPPALPKRAPAPTPARLAPPPPVDVEHIRGLADRGELGPALTAAQSQVGGSQSAEVQYLVAVISFEQGALDEAATAVRRALYLDPALAIAHFLDGAVAARRGRRDDARRAFRNARRILITRPVDEQVALGGGTCAGRLLALTDAQLLQLEVVP